jgi:hypothetical protein
MLLAPLTLVAVVSIFSYAVLVAGVSMCIQVCEVMQPRVDVVAMEKKNTLRKLQVMSVDIKRDKIS